MMTPLRWVTGGGDQEKVTCLCPTSASNISGESVGAGNSNNITQQELYYTYCTPISSCSDTISGTLGRC